MVWVASAPVCVVLTVVFAGLQSELMLRYRAHYQQLLLKLAEVVALPVAQAVALPVAQAVVEGLQQWLERLWLPHEVPPQTNHAGGDLLLGQPLPRQTAKETPWTGS